VRGQELPGYREEEGVAEDSRTETYLAARFFIDNWRWAGVPFTVRTGKRLPTRVTEAVIHFKQTPHRLFGRPSERCYDCNQLIIRIQPDEGILMKFNMKQPGNGFETKTVNMDFRYAELSDVYTPEAYERLLLDSMIGDATLYARSDAVEACWAFVDPILKAWQEGSTPLYGYPSGTWGPKEAQGLLGDPETDWRYPCRNLAEDGEFCEL
jgi:glucose-6-phosphate 1-dehydrogenase